jgi:hypothetical protein
MRTGSSFNWVVLVLLAAGVSLGRAQQVATNTVAAVNSSVTLQKSPAVTHKEAALPPTLTLGAPKDTNTMELQVSKDTQFTFSGPLVQPLKAKTSSSFVSRVAHWFNPFSNVQPNVVPAASGPMNTRAWSTITGWSPGHSAFPSAGAWNEPTHLDLVIITAQRKPLPQPEAP